MGPVKTPGDREIASFLAEMRATYVSDPNEAVASRHLPRWRAKPNWPNCGAHLNQEHGGGP